MSQGKIGGGRYDAECEALLMHASAAAVIVCVIDGSRGSGFSVSIDTRRTTPIDPVALANTLHEMADQIAKDGH